MELAGGVSDGNALRKALVIGDRRWGVFRRTGTSHLVAISRLHLGLVAGLVFWLSDRFFLRRSARLCLMTPVPQAAGLAAVATAAAYALLAGFSLPTQRALVMLSAGLVALSARRVIAPQDVLAIALVAGLLLHPNAVLGGGFWLSFAAVAVIFYTIGGRCLAGAVTSGWRIQWAMAFGLVPVLAAWDLPVAAVAPPVNPIAVPWFTLVVVPLSFLAMTVLFAAPEWGCSALTWSSGCSTRVSAPCNSRPACPAGTGRPATGAGGYRDDSSCVLRMSHRHASFLLTGDITRAVERRLAGKASARISSLCCIKEAVRRTPGNGLVPPARAAHAYRPAIATATVSRIRARSGAGALIIAVDAAGRTAVGEFRDAARRYGHR